MIIGSNGIIMMNIKWGFHGAMGVAQNGWFIVDNIGKSYSTWMIWGSPIDGKMKT